MCNAEYRTDTGSFWSILWKKKIMKAFGVHEMCDLEFKFITWWIKRYKVLVCAGIFLPLENLSLIWRRHQWRAANIDLCSALMAIMQWGFFSMSHLLWHWTSVYNGHIRGSVTLTPIAERLPLELSLPVSVVAKIRTPNLPLVGRML